MIVLVFYRILYGVVFGIALLALPFSPKLRQGILGRIGLLRRLKKKHLNSPIWFHFSSAGEFETTLAILDRLQIHAPNIPLCLTYFSPSAKKAIVLETAKRNGVVPWSFADYSPLEFPYFVKSFVRVLKPRSLNVVNKEFWPELLHQAKLNHIPLRLVATYFPKRPTPRIERALRHFDWIGAIDGATRDAVSRTIHIEVVGDPRLERIAHRRLQRPPAWRVFFESKTLVLGSIWPQDLAALKHQFAPLSRAGWRFLWVPHEPTKAFVHSILRLGKTWGETRRWSQFLRMPDTTSHLVVDQVGILTDLYSIAQIAFVGGSFKDCVHNVAEPAVYGIPVITGPKILNSAEALMLERLGSLFKMNEGNELGKIMEVALKTDVHAINDRFFANNRGIADKYALQILST